MEPWNRSMNSCCRRLRSVRVEAIARQRHDDRDAAPVEIASRRGRGSRRASPAGAARLTSRRSSLRRRLEELVLGEGLEQLDDGLVVVRAGDQVLGREDLLELVVQERRLGGRLHVRLRREQADQPRLADDLALGAHPPHADVVHARAPVHRRVGVGLREDQQVAVLDAATERRVERVEQRRVGERRASRRRTGCRARSPGPRWIARPSGASTSSYSR